MKNLLVFLILLSYSSIFAQASQYEKAMGKALPSLETQNPAELQKISNTFHRIATNMKTEWLPYYYEALALGRASFGNKEKGDDLADEAQKILDIATPLAKADRDKAELKVLQGLIYTAKLVVDPMNRGQLYSGMASTAYEEALKLDPTNPRAKSMRIRGQLGTAQFFKQDITPLIEESKEILAHWEDFEPSSRLHPKWGKEMTAEVANMPIKPSPAKKEIETSPEKRQAPAPVKVANKDGFSVQVAITDLRNSKGQLVVSIQNSKKEGKQTQNVKIENNQAFVQFNGLAKGKYSIRYFHDENEDGEINFGKWHIPTEGYGYSNDARGKMGPPALEETLFKVKSNVKMKLKTKY